MLKVVESAVPLHAAKTNTWDMNYLTNKDNTNASTKNKQMQYIKIVLPTKKREGYRKLVYEL